MPQQAPKAHPAARVYVRREPEQRILHRLVRDALVPFRAELASQAGGRGLPGFVDRELERFTRCGVLREGFARFRCPDCRTERLVALSCKGRGFCPSCLGRRMVERSADLVDRVLPYVPVRHWVLSLPFDLRYRLAWDHGLASEVLRIFARALDAFLRRGEPPASRPTRARTGAVTVIQRFGSGLNLNVHFHTVALDGHFVEDPDGKLRFRPSRAPTQAEVVELLTKIRARVLRLLVRRGLVAPETGEPEPDFDADPPALAELYAASVRQRLATGERRGLGPLRVRSAATVPPRAVRTGRHGARLDGFDLHASSSIRAKNRERMERLCRYLLRPPVAEDRLSESGDLVLLKLTRPWADGTTQLALSPTELLERLAALVPKPNVNLIVYHGVLAGHSRLRDRAVGYGRPPSARTAGRAAARAATADPKRSNSTWAELMRRGLGIDVLACPTCKGRMRHVATILSPAVAQRILDHLNLPHRRTTPPQPQPRAPPPAGSPEPGRPILERLLRLAPHG